MYRIKLQYVDELTVNNDNTTEYNKGNSKSIKTVIKGGHPCSMPAKNILKCIHIVQHPVAHTVHDDHESYPAEKLNWPP